MCEDHCVEAEEIEDLTRLEYVLPVLILQLDEAPRGLFVVLQSYCCLS